MSEAQEVAAVWVDVDELMPWVKNPRKNDDAAKQVAKSIKRFGFGAPLLARKANGEVIAGHTRLKAAKMLGLKTVPVRYLDLDPAEAHLLALADNKLGEKAAWDSSMVAEILSEYSLSDAELAGWDSAELEKLADEVVDFGPLDEEASDESASVDVPFGVLIECRDEEHQMELLAECQSRGLKCRALT